MATRTYLFTLEENAQFARLKALGFTRTDHLSGTEPASVFWEHEAHGASFTFHTEPYEGDDDELNWWQLQVTGTTNCGKYKCVVLDQLISTAQFDQITDPQAWPSVVADLRTESRGSVALRSYLESRAATL